MQKVEDFFILIEKTTDCIMQQHADAGGEYDATTRQNNWRKVKAQ